MTCKLCDKPLAYPGALFCGGACSARWEGGERPVDPRTCITCKSRMALVCGTCSVASPADDVASLIRRAAVLMRASKRGEVQAHVKDGAGWTALTLAEHRPAPEGPGVGYDAGSIRTDADRTVPGFVYDQVCAELHAMTAERDALRSDDEIRPGDVCSHCGATVSQRNVLSVCPKTERGPHDWRAGERGGAKWNQLKSELGLGASEGLDEMLVEVRSLLQLQLRPRSRAIDELIETSSLGTDEAKAAREAVPPGLVDAVLRRADELEKEHRMGVGLAWMLGADQPEREHVTGYFLRVKRDGKWQPVDIARMSEGELRAHFDHEEDVTRLRNWIVAIATWMRVHVVTGPENDHAAS